MANMLPSIQMPIDDHKTTTTKQLKQKQKTNPKNKDRPPLRNAKTIFIKCRELQISRYIKWVEVELECWDHKKVQQIVSFHQTKSKPVSKGHESTSVQNTDKTNLQYASTAWDPHLEKKFTDFEGVQRSVARIATNCRSTEPGCVSQARKASAEDPWRSEKGRLA